MVSRLVIGIARCIAMVKLSPVVVAYDGIPSRAAKSAPTGALGLGIV